MSTFWTYFLDFFGLAQLLSPAPESSMPTRGLGLERSYNLRRRVPSPSPRVGILLSGAGDRSCARPKKSRK